MIFFLKSVGIIFKDLFTLKARITVRERKEESSSICWFTLQVVATSGLGEVEARSIIQALTWVTGATSRLGHLLLPPPRPPRELHHKWHSHDTNQHPYMMLASQATALPYTKMLDPVDIFNQCSHQGSIKNKTKQKT